MGKFYNITIWLEDRELDLLEKYNFSEEVIESQIDKDYRWILLDLEIKGLLHSFIVNGKKYYQGSGGYRQILKK